MTKFSSQQIFTQSRKVTGTSTTIQYSDATSAILCSNSGGVTITVPTHASVSLIAGSRILVCNYGEGDVTFEGASGVTVSGNLTIPSESFAWIIKVDSTNWQVVSIGGGAAVDGGG